MSRIAVEELRKVPPPVGVGPKSWFRRWFPVDEKVTVSDAELIVLLICNVITTVGLAGDISRHLLHPDQLSNDFISSWHLVLYGGVLSVGIWLGVGVLFHGPAYMRAASGTMIGFALLSLGGVCDYLWHSAFGAEAAVEALVSPPHLVVFAGLAFLLTSPVVILWHRPARRLPGTELPPARSHVGRQLIVELDVAGHVGARRVGAQGEEAPGISGALGTDDDAVRQGIADETEQDPVATQ